MEFIYNDPILSKRRKGTVRDPFIPISETLFVVNGKVVLTEIPNRFNKVIVTGSKFPLYEIEDGELDDYTYKVDYPNGVVFFNSNFNNTSLTFTYLGEGAYFFPSSRIWINQDKNGSIEVLNDKFDDIDTRILEQKARVDEQIRSVPQPNEVVDIRIDHNGKVYSVAKDRIDAEQIKIENAYIAKDGTVYDSLKDRFDVNDDRLGVISTFKGTGRSLTEKIINEFTDRSINVKWFGAKGDGVTDDTSALQSALNESSNIYIPDGTYLISQSLVVKANTNIRMSINAVIIPNADIYCVFRNGNPTDNFSGYNGNGNIKIIGGTIDCNGQNMTNMIGGIVFGHAENILIQDVTIKNVREIHHIEINSSKNVLIERCKFSTFLGNRTYSEAIQIDLASSYDNFPLFGDYDNTICQYITVRDCTFENCGAGVGTHVQGSQLWHDHILVENCEFDNLLSHGISALNFKKFKIKDNVFRGTENGFYTDGGYDGMINNNDFKDIRTNAIMISNGSNIHINQATISRSGGNGITVFNGSKNIVINDVNITSSNANGINFTGSTDSIINNSVLDGNIGNGIFIHDQSKSITVTRVTVKNSGLAGINLSANAQRCNISNNILDSNCTVDSTYSNINIYTGATRNFVNGNITTLGSGKASFGIAVGSDAGDRNSLSGNDVSSGGTLGGLANANSTTILEGLDWKPLSLFNGWTTYTTGSELKYAVSGDRLLFKGIIKPGVLGATDDDASMVFKLPSDDSPRLAMFKITGGIGGGSTDFARLNFFTSGRVTIPTKGNLNAVDFTGLTLMR
ncbi:right-handed parallel beta-helix repeat-containing protein [Heyndrickxia camelliae]|uniref:Pectate lyase superfamily protein domain-containing protein n=1 Tax=Heyndrickxia camelliae TaxID=1707093 RepID=A0A2N3LDA7_9BACI|nr:right-handed parallel beta-helix repeat-containing protein [Heyndrickxia camelliae]PKR82601.1 hypothetical protein CWO92_23500 [Heyndrickxia camelliae]